eukprot:scaffold7928_cov36-Prasinocladus_malaysianus.AAC.1
MAEGAARLDYDFPTLRWKRKPTGRKESRRMARKKVRAAEVRVELSALCHGHGTGSSGNDGEGSAHRNDVDLFRDTGISLRTRSSRARIQSATVQQQANVFPLAQ